MRRVNDNAKAILSIIFVNVLWGLSFIASKRALGAGFQPFSLALVRFGVSAVVLLPILHRREGLALPKGALGRLVLSSLLGMTLYFLFEYSGLKRTSASTASLIIAAVPAFTLLSGVIVRRRRYPPVCYLGVLGSLAGVYLIVRYGANGGGDSLVGNLFILCAALCWVGYIEVTDALMTAHSSLKITCWQSVLGALTLIPCALTERVDWAAIEPVGWIMALYLSLLCSVVAYLLYVSAIRVLKPFQTSLFININPLAAVLGGVLLLGETVTPVQLIGGAVVLVSIFVVNRASIPAKRGT